MKIEELIYTSNMDQWGNCYGKNPPSTRQIVNKINEIIGWINSQEEGGEDEQG